MIPIKLSYIAKTLGWQLLGDDVVINSILTDSRSVVNGDCFVALYGDNFDAHAFIHQVIEQGACALIVSIEQENCNVPQLLVDDTRLALAKIAGLIKSLANVKTVAITGSCGKTTVKEMLSAILSQRGNVLATQGNFNNDIGAPLTLLRLTQEHQFAVIELGANHVGEIDFTSNITQPDVAIITNIGAAHLDGFGGIEGVVKAKSEIFNHLNDNGYAIFDADSEYSAQWKKQNSKQHIACFSDNSLAGEHSVWASDVELDDQGCARFLFNTLKGNILISLRIPGLHNVKNALSAGAAALVLGFELEIISQGLSIMGEVKGRLNVLKITPNITVIDDTYNANESSITAAIKVLASNQGNKILVLGDMAELGKYAIKSHQSLGAIIEQHNVNTLLTFGELSIHYSHGFNGEHHHFNNKNLLNKYIEQEVMNNKETKNTTILVKGSRSAAMESVVQFMQNNNNTGAHIQC